MFVVCGCVIEEEAAAIVMAHGAATGINLVLGSAGCQLAVRGSLPRTDFDPEVTWERTSIRRSGRMQQASSLRSPEPSRRSSTVSRSPHGIRLEQGIGIQIRFQSCTPSITAMDIFLRRIVDVAVAAERFGTPLYLYSAGTILDHYGRLNEALAGLDHLICYAVKANSNRAISAFVARCRCGLRHRFGWRTVSRAEGWR